MASVSQSNRPAPSAFGNLLKRLRMSANLTQEELAERAGVSARLISDLERGVVRRSRRDTVEMLAEGLKLDGTERATFSALARRQPATGTGDQQAPSAAPAALPAQPTPIIGREREISATTSMLVQPETRLLTLTGPGGVGKTRLAIETATRAAAAFGDGAVFVDLASLSNPRGVAAAITRALELPAGTGEPGVDDLAVALQDTRVLLLLDNMEHLIDAAPDIAVLLERCPSLTVLATSRQSLQIRAEREYRVNPLGLPDRDQQRSPETLGEAPAIKLFVERAETVQPSFALTDDNTGDVAAIVTRLDGLPLAIELAAARLRLLAPAELLARLSHSLPLLTGGPRDAPERQQTLRSAIDWSFELLDLAEQRLFSMLTVFTGGFGLDAAEYLAGRVGMDSDVNTLDTLASLVDKNLVRRSSDPDDKAGHGSRFRMLETIREYGLERLSTSDDRDEVRRCHAEWCDELASQSDAGLNGPEQASWLARLLRENDNFRAGLDWAIEMGEADLALRITGSLLRFWVTTGQFAEARNWYELALSLDPSLETAPRAKALLGIEVISYFQGDYAAAKAYGEDGLRIYQALDDPAGIGWSYGNLGLIADADEDYDRARDFYERALALFRQIEDRTHTHFMLGNLGLIAHFQGDHRRAAQLLEESLIISRELGNQTSIAINLSNLGLVAFARDDLDRATEYQIEALKIRAASQNSGGLAGSFDKFAAIAAAREDYERAIRLFAAADGIRTELGTALQSNDREFNRPHIERARHALGQERFFELWEEGVTMPPADAAEYALQSCAAGPPSPVTPAPSTDGTRIVHETGRRNR